eukprot:975801-Prorocentrum_lima.AAC.1
MLIISRLLHGCEVWPDLRPAEWRSSTPSSPPFISSVTTDPPLLTPNPDDEALRLLKFSSPGAASPS